MTCWKPCQFRFQSTLPRRERRQTIRTIIKLMIISIHTPTKGATVLRSNGWKIYNHFNPHSHEGSDNVGRSRCVVVEISIHTPTKGATAFIVSLVTVIIYFNPHSHEGSDITTFHIDNIKDQFQSTLPRRERPFLA